MHKDCLRVSSVIKEHKRVCCLIYLFLMEHCLFSFVVECVEKNTRISTLRERLITNYLYSKRKWHGDFAHRTVNVFLVLGIFES